MEEDVQQKVLEYETFVNEKLKEDLRKIHSLRDQNNVKIAEYIQFKKLLDALITKAIEGSALRTMVDLGCNFYCQAKIDKEKDTVLVAIGFGFFLEMTYKEALEFTEKKMKELTTENEKLSKQSAQVKARIKLLLGGLQELQSLDFQTDDRRVDIF